MVILYFMSHFTSSFVISIGFSSPLCTLLCKNGAVFPTVDLV